MQGKQQPEGRGHALAALEVEKHREQMAEKGEGAHQGGHEGSHVQIAGQHHRDHPFQHIAQ